MKRSIKNMTKIIFVLSILLATSCKVEHHLDKIDHHKQKAQEKGAVFHSDTVYKYLTKRDTIIDTLTNTVEIRTTVIDSVPIELTRVVYVDISRQERKRIKDSTRHVEKMKDRQIDSLQAELKAANKKNRIDKRHETKQEKNETKKVNKWAWYSAGAITVLVLLFLRTIIKYFKRVKKDLVS